MMRRTFLLFICGLWGSLCGIRVSAQAVDPPAGWKMSQAATGWIYQPADLPSGQSFTLHVDSPVALESADLNRFFAERVKIAGAQRGTLEQDGTIQSAPLGIVSLERLYRGADRQSWHMVYIAFPLTERRALFCYVASNLPESAPSMNTSTPGERFADRLQKT
jgi:hypothetical protein